jgi:hypothetical protein
MRASRRLRLDPDFANARLAAAATATSLLRGGNDCDDGDESGDGNDCDDPGHQVECNLGLEEEDEDQSQSDYDVLDALSVHSDSLFELPEREYVEDDEDEDEDEEEEEDDGDEGDEEATMDDESLDHEQERALLLEEEGEDEEGYDDDLEDDEVEDEGEGGDMLPRVGTRTGRTLNPKS